MVVEKLPSVSQHFHNNYDNKLLLLINNNYKKILLNYNDHGGIANYQ